VAEASLENSKIIAQLDFSQAQQNKDEKGFEESAAKFHSTSASIRHKELSL